jgi:hypothetical protein
MANHFVDGVNGHNTSSGHTMDAAWATVKYAEESGTLVAGDILWIRRNVNEISSSANITSAYAGTYAAPIYRIGCPRATVSITSSDWTNGNTSVTIDDGGMTEAAHCARMITAPDGNDYFISRVVSSTGITLLTEYTGTTVTNQAATIKADEDYALFNAIDDSAWTIKKADWNADAHTLPTIDFDDSAYYFNCAQYMPVFKNMLFKDSAAANVSPLNITNHRTASLIGCIFKQSAANSRCLNIGTYCVEIKNCVAIGSGTGSSQHGMYLSSTETTLTNVAAYKCGYYGMAVAGNAIMNNVNIGIEVANGSYDIYAISGFNSILARNLRLGGTNGYISNGVSYPGSKINIENYQTLGEHRTYYNFGYTMKQTMPDSTNVLKKVSDSVIKIVPNVSGYLAATTMTGWHQKVFEAVISATTASKSYKIWIYNRAMGTLNDTTAYDNIWMRLEYIKTYDDTSEYVVGYSDSTQIDIANAASSSDWDYLEVTSIAPALADKIRIIVYVNAYHASGMIYIDPSVVIS